MDPFTEANRALWEEWAQIHPGTEFYKLDEFRRGGSRIRPYELEEIGQYRGKDLLHLQCHFGIDTLSWARLGARVTGADYSENAVRQARALAAELGLEARFLCSPIEDLPNALEDRFDIVYTSRGVLGWLRDLDRWAAVIAHFLRPGGTFYITEIHPVVQVFDDDEGVTDLRFRYPYWDRPEPLEFEVKGSYADRDAQVSSPKEYAWAHSMGAIVTALASAGLRIDLLHELDFVDWPLPFLEQGPDGMWRLPKDQPGELPLFFSLRATKR